MKRLLPLAFILLLATGCSNRPAVASREMRYNQQSAEAYHAFLARRTTELKPMFPDSKDAALKARADADARFGGPPATYVWTMGPAASPQAEFNGQLDKMNRDREQ